MAVYLGSFNDKAIDKPAQEALAARLETSTGTRTSAASSVGARLYQGACAVCHEVGGAPLFGSRPSLALNSNLHSAVPDNLIQVILHGIAAPAATDLGYMPAFRGQPVPTARSPNWPPISGGNLLRTSLPGPISVPLSAVSGRNSALSCHAAAKTHWLGGPRRGRVPPWQ